MHSKSINKKYYVFDIVCICVDTSTTRIVVGSIARFV